MYRLLIVDDEPIIVEGLYKLFMECQSLELEIYKSYSGYEAIAFLKAIKIDIIILDIKMPKYSGDVLLEKIKKDWPECRVIILTGFNEFEYIYKAIHYDKVKYLLKSEGDLELIKTVEKVVCDIESERTNEDILINAQTQIKKALPLMKKELINSILNGEKFKEQELNELFISYEMHIYLHHPVVMLLCKIEYTEKDLSPSNITGVCFSIHNIITSHISRNILFEYIILNDKSNLLFIFQPKEVSIIEENVNEDTWNNLILNIKYNLDLIQNLSSELLGVSTSFIINSIPVPWNEIDKSYAKLRFLLNYGPGLSKGAILDDDILQKTNDTSRFDRIMIYNKARLLLDKIDLLKIYLENNEKDKYFSIFHNLLNELIVFANKDSFLAHEIYYSISLMYLSYLNRWGLMEKISSELCWDKLINISENIIWTEVSYYFQNLAELIFKYKDIESQNSISSIIQKAQQYVLSNLESNLSLCTLGDVVHLNPSYLSRLFKKVCGMNVSDFISNARLERAKTLLAESSMKVQDISVSVGFQSFSYFGYLFKKSFNMTPNDYREKYFNTKYSPKEVRDQKKSFELDESSPYMSQT